LRITARRLSKRNEYQPERRMKNKSEVARRQSVV
jgi:hypothetical protein